MKKIWLLIAIFSIVSVSNAIQVSGDQSGTWTSDNNPYQLIGDVLVPSGSTLTIGAGVNVEAMDDYQLNVEGVIVAEGNSTSPVHFYSANASLWSGIRLDSTEEGSSFSYCTIEHAEDGIKTLNTQVTISNCHFDNNDTGIHIYGLGNPDPPAVIIDNNLIENCQQNGIMIYEHNPVITNNEVRQCALDQTARAGIQMSCQSAGGICHPQIIDNHIHDNVWQGITAWDLFADGDISPTVKGNLIEENLTGVYLYDASGYFENNIIRNNFVAGNANSGAGVMLYGSTTYPTFCQNIFTGNFTGFYIVNGADADLGDVEQQTGRNLIYGNVDESQTTHSVYSGSTQQIMAENCFWDSIEPDEIQTTIHGSVDFDPLYSEENTACAFITGKIHGLENPDMIVHLVLESNRKTYATGYTTADSMYFLPVPFAGDFYVHVIESEGDFPLQGIYGGVETPEVIHIDEETITTGIDINELVEELPIFRTIEEPVIVQETEVFPYRQWNSIFMEQDYLLYHDDQGVRIMAFVDYRNGLELMEYPTEPSWLILDNPQPGDTWNSAYFGWDQEVHSLTAVVTPYGGDNEMIIDYNEDGDSSPIFRRQFILDNGLMSEKAYLGGALLYDYQVDEFNIAGGDGYMPISVGNRWDILRDMNHDNPMNLTAWHQQDNVYRLMWDPPFLPCDAPMWEGYYLYHNNQLLSELPFDEFWTDIEVPAGTNEYYLVAWGPAGETEPSNIVEIEYVSIGDEQDPTPQDLLSAQIFPNPYGLAAGTGVYMSIASPEAPEISLYNIRGQRVRAWAPERSSDGRYEIRWNGTDEVGRKVASGIYFARIESGRQTQVKKVVILQ